MQKDSVNRAVSHKTVPKYTANTSGPGRDHSLHSQIMKGSFINIALIHIKMSSHFPPVSHSVQSVLTQPENTGFFTLTQLTQFILLWFVNLHTLSNTVCIVLEKKCSTRINLAQLPIILSGKVNPAVQTQWFH